jgi:hypothetical protein
MLWWRPLREYLVALLRGYQSFVLGIVFGIAGAAGLFLSDQSGVRIAALVGVALGFVVAPYQAFQRIRQERDAARSANQARGLPLNLGYENLLSGGNWGIDNFEPPNVPGLVARAVTGVPYRLAQEAEFTSNDMDRFCELVARSQLAAWLDRNFPLAEEDAGQAWSLVAPCNGFEFTVARQPVAADGTGTETSARCMISLPRGVYGVLPRLFVDLIFRDVPKGGLSDGNRPDPYVRVELAGEPYRPTLAQLIEILESHRATLTEVAPAMLEQLVHRSWRERVRERALRRRLPLVGPNYHVRSKPRYLREAFKLPDFPRLGDGFNEIELMVQVPPRISAYDGQAQLALFRRGIRQILRYQQFRDFEPFVDLLGTAEQRTSEEPLAQSSADTVDAPLA